MKMLKIAPLLFILASTFFLSCDKNSNQSSGTATYYIKGKKDGTAFNFTTNTQAKVLTVGPVAMLNFIAGGTGSEGFNLGITSSTGAAINTGTYSEANAAVYAVAGVYNPNSTTTVYSAGIHATVKPLVINILTKTTTEVTGTFSGAFYRQSTGGTFSGDFITITEGEFKLKLQ
jgi:hypothetical protein